MTGQHDAPEGGVVQPVAWRFREADGLHWIYSDQSPHDTAAWAQCEPLYNVPPVTGQEVGTFATDDRIDKLQSALRECIDALALSEDEFTADRVHSDAVRALGEHIGYGAMMFTASALWADKLRVAGGKAGGQFTVGPCQSTVLRALKIARAALDTLLKDAADV